MEGGRAGFGPRGAAARALGADRGAAGPRSDHGDVHPERGGAEPRGASDARGADDGGAGVP